MLWTGSNLSTSFPARTGRFPFTNNFRKFRFGFKWSRGFRAFPLDWYIRSIRTNEMVVLFSTRNVPNWNSRPSCLNPSLIRVSDFLVCFSVNELIYANINRSVYDLIGLFLPQLFIYFIYFQFVFYLVLRNNSNKPKNRRACWSYENGRKSNELDNKTEGPRRRPSAGWTICLPSSLQCFMWFWIKQCPSWIIS